MSLQSAIARFRSRVPAFWGSQATVSRADGPPTFDPVLGTYNQPTVTVYVGPVRYRGADWEGHDIQAGEQEIRLRPARVYFPPGTPVSKDDVVTLDSCPDPTVVGKPFRVTDVAGDEWRGQIELMTIVEVST